MTIFRVTDPRSINTHLITNLEGFLKGRQSSSERNPVVLVSTDAFKTNVQGFTNTFSLSPQQFILSTKTLPVKRIVDVAENIGLRFLFYGYESFATLTAGWDSRKISRRAIVGDAQFTDATAEALIASGVRQFMITRVDAFETLSAAYQRVKVSTSEQARQGYLQRNGSAILSAPLVYFPLTGNPNPENHWFNKNVIPPRCLREVVEPILCAEQAGAATLGGVYIYSGNPFTRVTASSLRQELLTPANMGFLDYREFIWGGLGKTREHDAELQGIMAAVPTGRHSIDFGTALTYNSSALVARVRHLRHPLDVDEKRITVEWGLTTGAHDIKYIYAKSHVDVLLADLNGTILAPAGEGAGYDVSVDGASMASDDNNLGTLRLPTGVTKDSLGFVIFLDTQYIQAFEFRQQLLGGGHSLQTVVL